MSTLGWSVSEKDTEWKLASDVTCRGEKLMLRTATVRGWQPHPGVLSRACLATLPRVLMTGMLVPAEEKNVFTLLDDIWAVKFHRHQRNSTSSLFFPFKVKVSLCDSTRNHFGSGHFM